MSSVDKKQAIKFLLCCYFGRSDNLLLASIDRAYVDMASHTMTGRADYESKWLSRYQATKIIMERIKAYPCTETGFEDWHKSTISKIKNSYNPKLEEGKAQKWLNMTIKYLVVISSVLDGTDDELKPFKAFISKTNIEEYHAPVDRYVLYGLNENKYTTKGWSTFDEEEYGKIDMAIKEKAETNPFLWELDNWETFSNDVKKKDTPEEKSYAAFLKKDDFKLLKELETLEFI